MMFAFGRVPSGPSNYASFCAERNDPATSAIRPRKLVGTHIFSQAAANGLCFAIDRRPDQVSVYSDKNRPKVEPGQSLLIDGAGERVDNRASPCDDPAHQGADIVGSLQLSNRGIVEGGAGASGGLLE